MRSLMQFQLRLHVQGRTILQHLERKGKLMSSLRHAALHGLFPQLPLVGCQFVSDGPDGSLPGFAPARHGSHEVVRAQGVQMGPMSKEQGFQLP